jgi:UDP-2-acetamido-2-deoxy-ribo-hexuluronate aminotransferase
MIKLINSTRDWNYFKDEYIKAFVDVGSKGQFIQGYQVKNFEKELGKYLGVKHVISCANGTDALQIALMSLNLSSGDEVIVPAFTYIATVEVLLLLGLKPVYADIDSDSFNIDIDSISRVYTNRTKVIIPVHLFGKPANMDRIKQFADSKGLKIIEDAAQSLGSRCVVDKSLTHTGTGTDIGTTSFFPTKNLSCFGDGGAIFTNSDELAKLIRMIANHGQSEKYVHDLVGVNSRLDALQANILLLKLKRLDKDNKHRIMIANLYTSMLKEIDEIKCPESGGEFSHIYHQYSILTPSEDFRNKLREHLSREGIETGLYYPMPIYRQKAYYDESVTCPVSESCSRRILSLPINPYITSKEALTVVEKIISHVK